MVISLFFVLYILVISILDSFSLVLVNESSKRFSLVLFDENSKRFRLVLVQFESMKNYILVNF